ncbi:MAG: DsbA family oxidoreductase [Mycobacteriales bacterium]|nr:DsbA family oxidoreductase [Mycobacteriales bacterium]
MRIDIWSDVVCPWCYVGKRRLETALAQFPHPVEVVWHSFELDPSAPAERTGGYVDHLAAKYGRSLAEAQGMLDAMTETAAVEGLDFRFDLARGGSTFDAHRLLHLAAAKGLQGELKERLLRATFTEGEPIGHPEVLTRLAVSVGLEEAEVSWVLSGEAYADAVRQDEAEARRLGISGVPFFVVDGRYGVSGAQPAEVLLQVLEQGADQHSAEQHAGASCDDESCTV